MNRFRRTRDPEGKFALTTLQNPDIDIRPRLAAVQAVADAFDAQTAALATKKISAETGPLPPPPARTPEELAADVDLVSQLPFLQKLAAHAHIALDFLSPAEPPVPQAAPEIAAPENAVSKLAVSELTASGANAPEPLATPEQLSAAVATRKPKKRRRIFRGTPGAIVARVPARELTSLERHSRKCLICKHPDREEIDQEFLRWQHPDRIADDFDIPETRSLYRHARATGLLDLRRMNVRCALEFFIEEANRVVPEAEIIVRAIRSYTRINSRGEWNEPPSHMIYTNQSVENQLNVAIQPAPPPVAASAAEAPAIDIHPAEPDSNHVPAIRNHT